MTPRSYPAFDETLAPHAVLMRLAGLWLLVILICASSQKMVRLNARADQKRSYFMCVASSETLRA